MTALKELVKEFIEILETVEESDNGREFHPTTIQSCRVLQTKRIGELFEQMKEIIECSVNLTSVR